MGGPSLSEASGTCCKAHRGHLHRESTPQAVAVDPDSEQVGGSLDMSQGVWK